ncbi:Ig-like domain-containing protein [Clostridium sp. DSM 17811]|uniref:Ig-like domain-containing protein n=1 Tax=Clostridium sp. DSM 17811 TaxID=2843317 RepID=UPI001C0C77BB|nr:Ig-like domain-containing protein [Clostridium sp. DSM 17811]MBU3101777.1 Ig-like domain-containing protein [Clostridium sp. DSM 17811]
MVNKKLFKGLLKFVIVVIIASSSVSGIAHAATGDIINTTNKVMYNVTSSKEIQALIADLKDGGNDTFLKEDGNGKYYNPSDKLSAQKTAVVKSLQTGNIDLKDAAAIKAYIVNNAADIMTSVNTETAKVATQTIDTSNYTTASAITVTSVSTISTISTTVGTVPTLPTKVIATLSNGATTSAAITWDAAATTVGTYATAGTVTVKGVLADYGNYQVQANVIVNEASRVVVSVQKISNLYLNSNFPTTVIATLSDGTTKSLSVTWQRVVDNIVGASRFTGTLIMTDGVVNTNNITATVTLIVVPHVILIVSPLRAITITKTIGVGDAYTLPTTVTATLSDGTTKDLAVTWDKVASTTVAGTYTFTGTLTMVDEVINTNNVTASATLTVTTLINNQIRLNYHN